MARLNRHPTGTSCRLSVSHVLKQIRSQDRSLPFCWPVVRKSEKLKKYVGCRLYDLEYKYNLIPLNINVLLIAMVWTAQRCLVRKDSNLTTKSASSTDSPIPRRKVEISSDCGAKQRINNVSQQPVNEGPLPPVNLKETLHKIPFPRCLFPYLDDFYDDVDY